MNSNNLSAQCQANFTNIPDSVNSGGYFFFNTSIGGSTATSFWSFGDGTSSYQDNPYHLFTSVGYHIICLTMTDSVILCTSTHCDSIYVGTASPTCNANFTKTVSGNTATFTNSSTSSSGIITNYSWSFGDGSNSTATNPTHIYAAGGTYNVCLTMVDSSSGCSDQTCKNVTIAGAATCSAQFGVIDTGNSVYFYPLNGTPNTLTFLWNFGDGTTSTTYQPYHTYSQAGTYIACLTVTNLLNTCTDTYCDSVVYNPSGSGCNFQISYVNVSGNQFSFSVGNPASNIVSYLWSFGDSTANSTLANPTHTFANAGYYYVCLTTLTGSGCTSTVCALVGFGTTTCDASFIAFDSSGFVFFQPNSANTNQNYYWSFGDGSSSTQSNPAHQYIGNGPWTACLTVTDSTANCTDQSCMVITNPVMGNCNASFVATVDTSTYLTSFTNTSTGNYTNYSWSFGDGTASASPNPTHTYAMQGTYLVCLTVYNNTTGCQSSFCDSVYVGNPSANLCVPQFYSFPDSTIIGNGVVYLGIINPCPGSTYTWSVNGIVTGNGINQIITFVDSGWYYICVEGITPSGTYVTCDSVYSFRLAGPTGINENANQIYVSVSPNPTNGPLNLGFQLAQSENVHIQLMSIDGREVYGEQVRLSSGVHKQVIETENIQAGLYLIRLQAGDKQSISRIIIQH